MPWMVLAQWLGVFSLLSFIGSLVAIPFLIGRMDADYFVRGKRKAGERRRRHPWLCPVLMVLRNGAGLLLLAAGLVMLVLPGQGILTMLLGLALLDVPGKHALMGRMARWPKVRAALQWIRRKEGKEPFLL